MAAAAPPFDADGVTVQFLEAESNGAVAIDGDGLIVYVNHAAGQRLGYPPDELLGKPVDALVPADLVATFQGARARYLADPRPRPLGTGLELPVRRRDGSLWMAEIGLMPLTTSLGSWVLVSMVALEARDQAEERLVRLNRSYLTLAHLNEAVVRATDEEDLFRGVCTVAVEAGGYLGAWVALPGRDFRISEAARAGRLDAYLDQLLTTTDPDDPRSRGPTARALMEGRPSFSGDFLIDPTTAPWQAAAREHGIAASATLPLRRGGEVVAALNLYSGRAYAFDHHARALLQSVAWNVSSALDSFEARRRLEHTASQRAELLRRLIAAQEDERTRIANDIHDEPVQAMAAIDLQVGLLRRRLEEVAPELADLVAQIQEGVASAGRSLRQLLADLEPPQPGARLLDLLRHAAAQQLAEVDATWTVQLVDPTGGNADRQELERRLDALPDSVRIQVARIAREALINIRKHAAAGGVTVLVAPSVAGVEVTVADDGVGIDPDDTSPVSGHRGLSSMRDRAEIAGGWLQRDDSAAGTSVRFWLPRLNPVVLPGGDPGPV